MDIAKIKTLVIEKIKIGNRLRALGDVTELANSIKKIGLLQPVVIDEQYKLISGLHRLEACKQLGWKEISVSIQNLDGLTAELAEIDDNLLSNVLSKLERCIILNRRKKIYETLYPETKKGGDRKSIKTTKCRSDAKSFVKATATKLKKAERSIERDIAVGKKINPNIVAKLKNTKWENSQGALSRLVMHDHDKQENLVNSLLAGDLTSIPSTEVSKKQQDPSTTFYELIKSALANEKKATELLVSAQNEFQKSFKKIKKRKNELREKQRSLKNSLSRLDSQHGKLNKQISEDQP